MEDISNILMSYLHVTQHMSQQFRAHFGRLNLTFPQALVLNVLGDAGPVPISTLAERTGSANSTISGIVDRLEKLGLARRERSEHDRRVMSLPQRNIGSCGSRLPPTSAVISTPSWTRWDRRTRPWWPKRSANWRPRWRPIRPKRRPPDGAGVSTPVHNRKEHPFPWLTEVIIITAIAAGAGRS